MDVEWISDKQNARRVLAHVPDGTLWVWTEGRWWVEVNGNQASGREHSQEDAKKRSVMVYEVLAKALEN